MAKLTNRSSTNQDAKSLRQVVKESIGSVRQEIREAVDTILEGMDNLFKEQDKRNEAKFATKEDLKREVSWLRDDIHGLKADLTGTPSRKQFEDLKTKLDEHVLTHSH